MTARVRAAARTVGRGLGQLLAFPFRVVGWVLRGVGRAAAAVLEAVFDALSDLGR